MLTNDYFYRWVACNLHQYASMCLLLSGMAAWLQVLTLKKDREVYKAGILLKVCVNDSIVGDSPF